MYIKPCHIPPPLGWGRTKRAMPLEKLVRHELSFFLHIICRSWRSWEDILRCAKLQLSRAIYNAGKIRQTRLIWSHPYILNSKRNAPPICITQIASMRWPNVGLWSVGWLMVGVVLGHRSHRLQWPIVITRCPASVVRLSSVVRPSVRRPLDYLHFRLLLQNPLMDFDETWYGWSTQGPLQVLLFFGQIRPGADPGRGKNRSRGVPFFRKLLLQTRRLQQQTECIAVI